MKDKTVMKENTNICCCCSCLAVSKRLMWLGCRQELCNLEHSELSFKSESCEQGNHRQSSWQIRVDPMITEFGWSQVKYWFIIWGKTAIFEVQKSISKPPTHRQPGDMHMQSFDDAWLVTGFGLKSTFQKMQSDRIGQNHRDRCYRFLHIWKSPSGDNFPLSEKVDAVNIGSMCHKGEGQYGPQIMTSSTRPPPRKSPKHFLLRFLCWIYLHQTCLYSIE